MWNFIEIRHKTLPRLYFIFYLFLTFCQSFLFFFLTFYWSIVALQCYVSFYCIARWISYTETYIPSCLDFLPIWVTRSMGFLSTVKINISDFFILYLGCYLNKIPSRFTKKQLSAIGFWSQFPNRICLRTSKYKKVW